MPACNQSVKNIARVYFAAPLFSEAEQTFNLNITTLLENHVAVYLPQRDGGLMSEMINKGVQSGVAARHIFCCDFKAILQADCLVAVLDGRAIDEGVAFELGVAFSHKKICVGLQTDIRRLAGWGNNPMITGALDSIFASTDELIEWVKTAQLYNQMSAHSDEQMDVLSVDSLL